MVDRWRYRAIDGTAGLGDRRHMHTLEQLRSGALAGTQALRLTGAGLAVFPREIFDLADTLEILDLSGNALETLPDDLPRLIRLRILFASNNAFTTLPAVLGSCPSLTMIGFKANRIKTVPADALPAGLRWLILTDNAVDTLPAEIGRCTRLQKLMLAGNRLTALPQALSACTALELVRIAANRLPALPDWLPAMPRLSWLAFAGNPFAVEPVVPAAARTLAWNDLTLEATLGEGASGVISRATLPGGSHLAVKVFKGAVTSDGLPHSEMMACLAAGAHPNLIPVRGRVTGHPEGREALAMDLIDPAFVPLAGPPSFETCTRDVYADGTRFDLDTVQRIASGIASAAAQLHSRGLMHGDLYAHNILVAPGQAPVIGDFGAASAYAANGEALQRLEVRAFGCLLEELINHCLTPVTDLTELAAACQNEDPTQRPLFEEIVTRLRASGGRPI